MRLPFITNLAVMGMSTLIFKCEWHSVEPQK